MNKNGRVTGIGGIFFKARDPKAMREWYDHHLGLVTNEYGSLFEFRHAAAPTPCSAYAPTTTKVCACPPEGDEATVTDPPPPTVCNSACDRVTECVWPELEDVA